jgi:Mut7-C RNAse domain
MVERAACPEAFHVETRDLMTALVDLCLRYRIDLTEDKLLSVCGKCGGDIIEYEKSTAPKTTIWPGDKEKIPDNVPILICESCSQLYWWNETEVSSPAVAMRAAKGVFDSVRTAMLARANEDDVEGSAEGKDTKNYGDPPSGDCEMSSAVTDTTSSLDYLFNARVSYLRRVETELQETKKLEESDQNALKKSEEILSNNLYKSVFPTEPEYTNSNGNFKGTLDYIFTSPDITAISSRLIFSTNQTRTHFPLEVAPEAAKSQRKLEEDLPSSSSTHSDSDSSSSTFPSIEWPSDHFLILTTLDW